MYEDFHASDPLTGKDYHCMFQCLIVGIATRHSDTVDIKFLVSGTGVWIGLPHPAWVEFKERTGQTLTDRMAVDLAGLFLKHSIESGLGVDVQRESEGDVADPLNPNPVTVHSERSHRWTDITVADVLALCAELGWLPADNAPAPRTLAWQSPEPSVAPAMPAQTRS